MSPGYQYFPHNEYHRPYIAAISAIHEKIIDIMGDIAEPTKIPAIDIKRHRMAQCLRLSNIL